MTGLDRWPGSSVVESKKGRKECCRPGLIGGWEAESRECSASIGKVPGLSSGLATAFFFLSCYTFVTFALDQNY